MASLTKQFEKLYGRSPKSGETLVSGGSTYRYKDGMWVRTRKATTETKDRTEPTPTAGISSKIEEIKRKAEEIKKKLSTLQQAKQAGMKITPKTTVEEAEEFLVSAKDLTRKTKIKVPELRYGEDYTVDEAKTAADRIKAASEGLTDFYKTVLLPKLEDIEKEKEEMRKEKEEALKKLTAPPEETREEALERLRKEYGIPAKMEQVEQQNIKVAQLREQIRQLDDQRQREIDRAYQMKAPMETIKITVSEINREYDSKQAKLSYQLGTEAALLQAYVGNLEVVESLVDDAIKNWMWDYEENRKRWQALYTYYSDVLDDLTDEEKQLINTAYQEALRAEEAVREEKEFIRDLAISLAQNGIVVDFGKMLEMSVDDAVDYYNKKIGEVASAINISEYFSPEQLRQLRRAGIDPTTPEGFQQALEMFPPESDKWEKAENYILQNLKAFGEEVDMAGLYATLIADPPKGIGLNSTDARALMAQYGMVNISGQWIYYPTEIPTTEEGEVIKETEEKKQPWWKKAVSEIWHRLPFVK